MFEQLKQLKKLQEIQKALKDERVEYEKQGIKVTINGKLEIEDIKLNPALPGDQQEKMLKEVLNEGMKKIQMTVAQKMQAMGGLGF
jgi:DNA-binding protein YbaB